MNEAIDYVDTVSMIAHMATLGWRVEIHHHHDTYFALAVTPDLIRWRSCHAESDHVVNTFKNLYRDWQDEVYGTKTVGESVGEIPNTRDSIS